MRPMIAFTLVALLTTSLAAAAAQGRGAARKPAGKAERPPAPAGATKGAADKPEMTRPESGSRPSSPGVPANLKGRVPEPSATQQQKLQDAKASLGSLGQGGASKDEVQKLAQDLSQMADNPPDKALVEDLARDLGAALSDSSLSEPELAQLTSDLYAVMNSAGLTPKEIKTLQQDVAALLASAGASQQEVQAVTSDIQQMATARSGKPKR